MKARTCLAVIIVSVSALFVLFLSYRLAGSCTLEKAERTGLPVTYSTESIILSAMNRNSLTISEKAIRKALERLPYILNATVRIKGKVLSVSGKSVENALMITDGKRWYLYSDSFHELDRRDVSGLGEIYQILIVDSSILDNALSSSFSRTEKEMIDTLIELKRSSNLITIAEYGNNNSSGYPLSLYLRLSSISSSLILTDVSDSGRIKEALEIIGNEYSQYGSMPDSERKEYVLTQGRLIVTR